MVDFDGISAGAEQASVPLGEAARRLGVEPRFVWQWSRRFAQFLDAEASHDPPRFSSTDLLTLGAVQTLLVQGYSDEQVKRHLLDRLRSKKPDLYEVTQVDAAQTHELLPNAAKENSLPAGLHDVFSVIANGQRAILSNQTTMREMVGVVVQDNFNLKEENRKLRERMLEIERTLAETQRRDELRKERLESRLRALEGAVAGLQQQFAQLLQALRKKRRGWFG